MNYFTFQIQELNFSGVKATPLYMFSANIYSFANVHVSIKILLRFIFIAYSSSGASKVMVFLTSHSNDTQIQGGVIYE